jgi:hypothetical protein
LEADPASEEAEKILSDISERFPTMDEPREMLAAVRSARAEQARRKAEAALKVATDFEQEHQLNEARYPEIVQRFRDAQAAAGGVSEVAQRAKDRGDYWEKRVAEVRVDRARAAWHDATSKIDEALALRDFDTARTLLTQFRAVPGQETLKGEVDAKAADIDQRATDLLQKAKTEAERAAKDPAHPVPLGLDVWNDYLGKVKDATGRAEAEAARKVLEDRAEAACAKEDQRITELAKQYDFDGAAGALRILRERLSGTRWADERAARLDDLTQLRALHKRVIAAIAERVRVGPLPVPLPFKVKVPRFDVEDWGIGAACDNDQALRLDAIVKGAAPGCQKRFAELDAGDVYKLYVMFVPPKTAEDHKAYAVFCRERGLDALAADHQAKAAK